MMYTLYKYNMATTEWQVHAKFENKDALIRFLSRGTSSFMLKRAHWSNTYIDNQNLTRKDTSVVRVWDKVRRMYEDEFFRDEYFQRVETVIRPWHLEDAEGRTVDMKMFRNEVYDYIENGSVHTYYNGKYLTRQGQRSHHRYQYRHGSKNHVFGRTVKTQDEDPEGFDELLTAHQQQSLKVKPKDKYAKFAWWDDFITSGPTGWKNNKHTYQWEPKQKRTPAVWVDKDSPKTVKYEPVEMDECSDEYVVNI